MNCFYFILLLVSFSINATSLNLKYNHINFLPIDVDGYKIYAKYSNWHISFSVDNDVANMCSETGIVLSHFRDKLAYILQRKVDADKKCYITSINKSNNDILGQVTSNRALEKVQTVIETSILLENKYTSKDHYFLLRRVNSLIVKFPSSIILKLAQIVLYQEVGNGVRANRIIKKLVQQEAFSILFDVNYLVIRDKLLSQKFSMSIVNLIKKIIKNIKNEVWSSIFVEAITDIIKIDGLKKIKERYGVNWSLQEIDKLSKSGVYGYSICSFWYFQLKRREGSTNVNDYLDSCLTVNKLKQMPNNQLWILLYFMTSNKVKRSILIERVKEVLNSDDNYTIFTRMRMLKNDMLFGILKEVNKDVKSPIFRQERQFYKKLFKEREAVPLATYHLLRLGERGEELLSWPKAQAL